jgi:hypothetical protein
VFGEHAPGSKSWQDLFAQGPFKTASKWLTRSVVVEVNGPAPKLSTASETVAVSGLASGAITGAAVISYPGPFTGLPAGTCLLGGKKYTPVTSIYSGTAKTTKPFQAHTVLAGTLTAKTPTQGTYIAVRLQAPVTAQR